MRSRVVVALSLAFAASLGAFVAACDDDVDTFGNATSDAGDAAARDGAGDGDAPESVDASTDGAGARASRLLVAAVDFVGGASEVVAVGVEGATAGGGLTLASTAPTVVASAGRIFVVARDTGVISELGGDNGVRAQQTWVVDRAAADGGGRAASSASVIAAGAKAYAVLADSNTVTVLDSAHAGEAGAGGTALRLSLAPYVQPGDTDGVVDVLDGVYVPARRLVYLVLRNVDTTTATPDGVVACTGTTSTVVGLDVDSDTFVDLNGDDDGKALELAGVNPVAVAYDATGDRLLVAHAGCTPRGLGDAGTDASSDTDAGVSVVGRQVDELSLFTNATRVLLDARTLGTPTRFVLVDDRRAVVQLVTDDAVRRTFVWDPASPTLGRAIAAPDAFSLDPLGNVFGVERQFTHDGGADSYDAIRLRVADGRKATVGTVPFTAKEPFVASTTFVAR